jgi:hypothetical protein
VTTRSPGGAEEAEEGLAAELEEQAEGGREPEEEAEGGQGAEAAEAEAEATNSAFVAEVQAILATLKSKGNEAERGYVNKVARFKARSKARALRA